MRLMLCHPVDCVGRIYEINVRLMLWGFDYGKKTGGRRNLVDEGTKDDDVREERIPSFIMFSFSDHVSKV